VEARFSASVQAGLGLTQRRAQWLPSLFPGVKRPGRCVDFPTPSSAKVKERVELYLYWPSGTTGPLLGWTYLLTFLLLLLLLLLLCCCCCLLSQAFSSRYFSWTSSDSHRTSFKFQTAVFSVLCVMFLVFL